MNYKGVVFWKEKVQRTYPMATNIGTTTWTDLFKFKLSDLANSGNFQNMWDYYRITGIKATFYPMSNAVPVDSAAGLQAYLNAQIACKVDLDGGAPWASWANALEANARVRQFTGNYPVHCYVKAPKLNYRAAESTSQPTQNVITFPSGHKQNWVDMRYDDAEYHGMQVAVHNPPNTATANSELQVVFTYYLAFKGHL